MGTHPIFESDFDCLTETKNVVENWHRVSGDQAVLLGRNRHLTGNGPQRGRSGMGHLVYGLVDHGWRRAGAANLLKESHLHHFLRGGRHLWHYYFDYYGE